MLKLTRETMLEVFAEIQPLLERHYRELSLYQDIPLDPRYERYESAERLGYLRIYTAREDGELVGYGIFVVDWALHYRSSMQAIQDIFWVAPEHRGTTGVRLIRYCENELRKDGVQVLRHHVKDRHQTLGQVLERMGYQAEDILYSKRLD